MISESHHVAQISQKEILGIVILLTKNLLLSVSSFTSLNCFKTRLVNVFLVYVTNYACTSTFLGIPITHELNNKIVILAKYLVTTVA